MYTYNQLDLIFMIIKHLLSSNDDIKPMLYSLHSSNLEKILYTVYLFIHSLGTDLTILIPVLNLSRDSQHMSVEQTSYF